MVSLFDTHCHLDVPEFDADRTDVIARAHNLGVSRMLVPGVMRCAWPAQARVVDPSAGMFAAYGLHPCYLDQHQPGDAAALPGWLQAHPAIAVGEIGLDFWESTPDPRPQVELFEAQLGVAEALGLPVILHARKSHDVLLKSLRRFRIAGGIIHAWSGSEEQARRAVDAGFVLGFGGGITYDRAKKLRRLIRALPDSAWVLETDAPDIPPSFSRQGRNEPAHLASIAAIVADVLDTPLDEVLRCAWNNACRVLRLPV